MEFCVVEFDDGVQVVPENWITGDSCFWPSHFTTNKQFEEAVRIFMEPHSEIWSLHKCNILGVYPSYEVARAKLKCAEEKTDIDSLTDAEQARKRRKLKKKKQFSDNSSSSSENELSSTIVHKFPSPPTKNRSKITEKKIIGAPTTSAVPQPAKSTPLQCGDSTPIRKVQKDDEFQRRLFRELALIKFDIKRLQETVENMDRGGHSSTNNTNVDDDVVKNFPINNDDALRILEASLTSDVDFKTRLIDRLGRMGGNTEDEVTKRILRLVFTDMFGANFSWCAGKGKRNFSSLQLSQVIIKAVQFHSSTFKDLNIIRSIQNWLRHASARHANKEKRSQKVNEAEKK